MKKVLIGLLVALMAASSFAGIVVGWDTGGFLSGATGNPYVFDTGDDSTTKLVWDLVYTTDSSITTPVLNETTGEITYGANDKIVSQRIATPSAAGVNTVITDLISSSQVSVSPQEMDAGGYLTNVKYQNTEFPYSSGGLYAAVFQYTSDNTVYYAVTDLFSGTSVNWANDGSATPTEVCFDLTADTQLEKLGSFTPVPEPATMSLLGLGALAMVIRRKLRK